MNKIYKKGKQIRNFDKLMDRLEKGYPVFIFDQFKTAEEAIKEDVDIMVDWCCDGHIYLAYTIENTYVHIKYLANDIYQLPEILRGNTAEEVFKKITNDIQYGIYDKKNDIIKYSGYQDEIAFDAIIRPITKKQRQIFEKTIKLIGELYE